SDKNDDSEETKSDDVGDDFTNPSISTYTASDQEEEKEEEEEEEKADDDEDISNQRVYTPPDYQHSDEEANQVGDDTVKEITKAQAIKDTEDAHVTLIVVPPVVQQQSSLVSSNLVSKYINLSLDAGIDSVLNKNIQSNTLVDIPVTIAILRRSFKPI
ncbi:hypothetical protein Tco_0148189, partial [Tanacetum coccineum]